MIKKFKCTNCNKKFEITTKAYYNAKLVCQKCFFKLKEKDKYKYK